MTIWTPRPPNPDEPACWSWPVLPSLSLEAAIAKDMAATGLPEDVSRMALEGAAGVPGMRLVDFHAGRCAICGRPGAAVEDHDHFTGLVRGYLDLSCNVVEGIGRRGGRWAAYGDMHPAKILGVEIYYVGMHWPDGWWEDSYTAYRLTGNPKWASEPVSAATGWNNAGTRIRQVRPDDQEATPA